MNDSPYGFIKIKYDDDTPIAPKHEKMDKPEMVELAFISGILGFAVLGFDLFKEIFVKVFANSPLYPYYESSVAMVYIVQIFFSLFAIMIPFGIALGLIKLVRRKETFLPLWKPNSKKMFFASLAIAFLTLIISNFLTSLGVLGLEGLGFELEGGDSVEAESFSEYLWMVLSIVVVPAFAEEFAIRGVIMQTLRKYGDVFAIVVSSLMFGLMHGNLMQAPFAFLLGLVMGWLVIQTDSLWTGIAIHFMNNFYASALTTIEPLVSQPVYIAIAASVNIIGSLLGVYAIVWYIEKKQGKLNLKNKYSWQPFVVGLLSLPMLAAIIRLIYICAESITYTGWLQ